MVLDYSQKRGNRETLERKPIQKNRPRKEPVGMFVLLSVVALMVTFVAGVGTGWLLFRGPSQAAPVAVVAKPAPEPVAAHADPAVPEPPLTFYKTLPVGGMGTFGTGLNLRKVEHAPTAAPPPAQGAAHDPPQAAPATAPQDAPQAAPVSPAAAGAEETREGAKLFLVQVGSYRDKQEADAAQAKLAGKGVAAYVVESRLKDKGVWYRIRVGKNLAKAEAELLAAKFGKGTLVLAQ